MSATNPLGKVYDISVVLGRESIDYPGDPPCSRELICTLEGGADYDLSKLTMSAHSGTHLDVPAHFFPDGKTIDRYCAEDFLFRAQVIDIHDNEAVRVPELSSLQILPGDALLFRTENSRQTRCRAGTFSEDYVYVSAEAADFCVALGVGLVGIDYVSVDRFGDETYPSHRKILGNDCLILEGIDLEKVTPGTYTLVCLPLKIPGAEASPVRAILIA